MTELEQYFHNIRAFEQAASLLLQEKKRQAEQYVLAMPEACYEAGLAFYGKNKQDYPYFLARYVLASVERDPEQQPAQQDLDKYLAQMLELSDKRPERIRIGSNTYRIDWKSWTGMLKGQRLQVIVSSFVIIAYNRC